MSGDGGYVRKIWEPYFDKNYISPNFLQPPWGPRQDNSDLWQAHRVGTDQEMHKGWGMNFWYLGTGWYELGEL